MTVRPGSAAWLGLLCVARMLGSTWFVAYSAVLVLTQQAWGLSGKEAGMVQSAYHLGYLTSLFLVGFYADHAGAKRAYVLSGIAAWVSPFLFVAWAEGFWSALWLHALTGLCQGGLYTPVLALLNDHVPRERRGRAMGFFIGASSAGYALALATSAVVLKFAAFREALFAMAVFPLAAWLLSVWMLRGTENRVHPRPAGESLISALPAVWRNRRTMLSVWGYTTHNWELLGLWAWLPAFLGAALLAQGSSIENALVFTAFTYTANIAGSALGGAMADRWGRTQTILFWSCLSAGLTLSIGWMMALPVALLVAIACVHNLSAIADSSTHSTVIAELTPAHYLGVAYALRSVIGFGAGVFSPVVFGWVLDLNQGSGHAWGLAWTTLGAVAALGPFITWRLHRSR